MPAPHLEQIPFGQRSGLKVSRVSIGAMRLPADVDQAVALIRHAIDSGMRYIDTCRSYGDSEIKVGKALKDGYREKVILSTKWAPWISKIDKDDDASADCVLKRLEESMKRLDVDHLDFYQVWNLKDRQAYKETVRKGGFLEGVMKAKDRGLIGHTGITSHDSVENLLKYLDDMDWCEVILLSYNVLSSTYAPVLSKAKSLGIGTIVMNPVGGGKLAENSLVFAELARIMGCSSVADLAVRYVLSNPDVDVIISGISKTGDVDGTIASSLKKPLTQEQRERIDAFVAANSPQSVKFCTGCGYCMPCPQEVNIPRIMDAIYHQRFLGFSQNARESYAGIGVNSWTPGKKADECTACGECMSKCTQNLDIPEEMGYARKTFG